MKFFSPPLFLAVIAPAVLFAQSNFKSGYIVMPKGDTVKGYIDYREWDNNPGPDASNYAINN